MLKNCCYWSFFSLHTCLSHVVLYDVCGQAKGLLSCSVYCTLETFVKVPEIFIVRPRAFLSWLDVLKAQTRLLIIRFWPVTGLGSLTENIRCWYLYIFSCFVLFWQKKNISHGRFFAATYKTARVPGSQVGIKSLGVASGYTAGLSQKGIHTITCSPWVAGTVS